MDTKQAISLILIAVLASLLVRLGIVNPIVPESVRKIVTKLY